MTISRPLSRRSSLIRIVGGAFAGAGVIGLTAAGEAVANVNGGSRCTDNDASDRPSESRHCRTHPLRAPFTGVTDRDASDPVGHGRGHRLLRRARFGTAFRRLHGE